MLNYIKFFALIILFINACSSDEGIIDPNTGSLVIGILTVNNIEKWPTDKSILFQMFELENSSNPDVSVELVKPTSGNSITIKAKNVVRKTYKKVIIVELDKASNKASTLVEYGQIVVSNNTESLSNKTLSFTNISGHTFARVELEIIEPSCVSCHSESNPQGGLSLSSGVSYKNLINITAVYNSSFVQIKPYESEKSYFYLTLIDSLDAPLMPPLPLEALTKNQIELVKKWIDEGALNN